MNALKIITLGLISFLGLQTCSTSDIKGREIKMDNSKILFGLQDPNRIEKEAPYSEWFKPEYSSYKMDIPTITELKKINKTGLKIRLFIGTWCSDSHTQVPRLYKILDEIGFNRKNIELVALSRQMNSPSGEEAKENIQKVPTIIVDRFGKNLGRIVESPESGYLEKDLLKIIKG